MENEEENKQENSAIESNEQNDQTNEADNAEPLQQEEEEETSPPEEKPSLQITALQRVHVFVWNVYNIIRNLNILQEWLRLQKEKQMKEAIRDFPTPSLNEPFSPPPFATKSITSDDSSSPAAIK